MDVVGHQVGTALERQQRFFVAGQLAERFAQQVAGAAVAVHQCAATLQDAEGMLVHAELDVALGFFDRATQLDAIAGHASLPLVRLTRYRKPDE